jgi:hypothetical protein
LRLEPSMTGKSFLQNNKRSKLRRSTRESRSVSRLEPSMTGKLYLQNDKKILKKAAFAEDKLRQLEYCHNLVSQVKPEKEKTIKYGSCQAMLIARFIQDECQSARSFLCATIYIAKRTESIWTKRT